jgi:ankyrin repeat protein
MINDDLQMFNKYYQKQDKQLLKDAYSTDQICDMTTNDPTLIMYAAAYGANRIFQFIERTSSGASKDKMGRTLRWFAAAGGSKTILRLTDQSSGVKDGSLQAAEQYHQNEIYDTLKKNKRVSFAGPDRNGRLPIVVAAAVNNIYALIDLLKSDISPSVCESFGRTALQAAAENGHCDALRILLECDNIDVNACDCWGVTSLHIAADKCQVDAIKLLLGAPGIDVNSRTEALKTPLHIAVETEYSEITKLFINLRDVDVNAQNKRGATPMHTAVKLRNHNILKLLLKRRDIRLDLKDKKGRTPYMIAFEMEDDEAIGIFETYSNETNKECRI